MKEVSINLEDKIENSEKQKKTSKIRNLLKNKYFIMIVVLVIGSIVAASFMVYYILNSGKQQTVDTTYKLIEAEKIQNKLIDIKIPDPPEVKEFENPLNGTLLTKSEYEKMLERPVVVVMINNHIAARPQSGHSKADIVYESLVEGGITRYMGIFWGPEAVTVKEVGPIRSIRQYFVDWAIEYKVPVIMHIGWAGYDKGIDNVIVPEADARSYILSHPEQLKSLQSGFWRDPNRVAPHNAYNSLSNILNVAKANGWKNQGARDPYKFKPDEKMDKRPLTSTLDINFLQNRSNYYSVRWTYDKDTNSYNRFVGGKKDIDKLTSKQVRAKNIIVQLLPYQSANDEHARILLDTVGSGKAYYMLDGKVIEGKWSKASKTDMTKYYDKDGKDITLNRGQIWIEMIPVNKDGEVLGGLNFN